MRRRVGRRAEGLEILGWGFAVEGVVGVVVVEAVGEGVDEGLQLVEGLCHGNSSRVAVGRLVAGEGGAQFFVSNSFGSLAEIEHFRQKSQDDAGRLKIIEQALPLMARPVSFEIRQILMATQIA